MTTTKYTQRVRHTKPNTGNPMPYNPIIFQCCLLIFTLLSFNNANAKNIKPLAAAGTAQSVLVGSRVFLDGSQSSDSDGSITKWRWTQIKGTKVKIYNVKERITSFISPKLKPRKASDTLIFKLTVTDNKKATAVANVQITVNPLPICIFPETLQNGQCIAPLECEPPQILKNGICITPPKICYAPQVLIKGQCIIPQLSCELPLVLKDGACVTPETSGIFNDTGIMKCSDGSTNVTSCGIAQFPGQDAEFGRDTTHNNNKDGHAGFSFTKISEAGAELPIDSNEWSCIKDNVTGLLWEVKTDDDGLHDKDINYSNYSPDFNPNNEYASATDATGFVTTVNSQGFCGVTNWRLPTNIELHSIVDYSVALPGPTIDQNFFANTRNSAFWTSSLHPKGANVAWVVFFDDGRIFDNNRAGEGSVRLVSGTYPEHLYSILTDDQEVIDNTTGLIWRRCAEGMQWDGSTCLGTASGYMFQEALQQADLVKYNSGKNWRLPNLKELASLVDTNTNNGMVIDGVAFPGTLNDHYWTSSSYSTDAFFAWVVNFFYGSVYYTYTEDTGLVRLVCDKN